MLSLLKQEFAEIDCDSDQFISQDELIKFLVLKAGDKSTEN
jgi:hypothetical protein